MKISDQQQVQIPLNGNELKEVDKFTTLGSMISTTGGTDENIKACLGIARFVCWLATCSCISGMDLLRQFTCCHTSIEVADQTFHLTQSQFTDTGPTSPSTDPITPGAWQGSHWSASFEVTGMTQPQKSPCRKWDSNPGSSALQADALTTNLTRQLGIARHAFSTYKPDGSLPLSLPGTSSVS